MSYEVTFWGARGSIPTPGQATVRYGGNTPCVQLQRPHEPNGIIILDAGTGIRGVGQMLVNEREYGAVSVDLILTHTHWDHIQGLPFFLPLLERGNEIRIWGARQGTVDLESIIRDQMRPVVFPVPLDELEADISVKHVDVGEFHANGFAVRGMRVRHPGTTLGYVLIPADGDDRFAFVPDNELTGGSYDEAPGWRKEFTEFLSGSKVLVHDAMYTDQELKTYSGWGHSSNVEAVRLAHEAGVPKVVLFHHRPEHDDGTIDAMVEEAGEVADKLGGVEVVAAHEGMKLNL
jgi:phosphoribosyl 1,2-cyclic phosphodiesterase